jgi:site-specific DNA-methyltransferase (adenine-specific)
MDTNVLYYGDNLEIMRKHIPDESVDLIYLDPPFNSSATYNVLFKEPSGKSSQAQMSAFEDTWHWGLESEKALQEIAASSIAPAATKEFMSVLPNLVGKRTDMSAYITMMCVRLIELRRVLKDIGSIYLHCDPTASHYLKLLMDTIFGVQNYRNEIIWKRTSSHSDAKRYAKISDSILFYTKTENYIWNKPHGAYAEEYKNTYYCHTDDKGRQFTYSDIGKPKGSIGYFYQLLDCAPPPNGWRMPEKRAQQWLSEGRIEIPPSGKTPRYKRYLDELEGPVITNIWDDIPPINSQAKERLGYPTQKPEELLERIIKVSSNVGDIVLDPFCGCGTAVVAAQNLKRRWIGMDITHLAIGLMKWRLKNLTPPAKFTVIGEPKDLTGAQKLAEDNKYQFQWWAVAEIGGQPYGEKKKGADTGIDGYSYYMDEKDKIKKAIISVKGGHNANVSMIRDLGHVIDREKADIGIFISIDEPTRPMVEEAAMKGFYHSPLDRDYPRIQILTIAQILEGKRPDIPPWIAPIPKNTNNKNAIRENQSKYELF